MIQNIDLIIWDEAVKAHRNIFKAVDLTLRNLMSQIGLKNKEIYFGNKVMLFGGDFRQILL